MKKRLDTVLVKKGYFQSRERAKAVIMSGIVYVNNQKADKAGFMVSDDVTIEIRGKNLQYVSRGGLKLEKAINTFHISLNNAVCMDIGASTGGFTDCMLQNGAQKVYAVDVGYGQLAWKLRTDTRVTVLERTNIRYVTNEQIPDKMDFISIDVSFISLTLVLPVAFSFLKDHGEIVALIKPQFEAGREKVGKKGVVRDPDTHFEVISKIIHFVIQSNFNVKDITFSPVRGPEGNIEYLIHITNEAPHTDSMDDLIHHIVNLAHQSFKGGEDNEKNSHTPE